jgi:cell division protein FtsA
LKYASIVPIGGDSITSDIALGLRTSIDVAEELKNSYGEVGLDAIE